MAKDRSAADLDRRPDIPPRPGKRIGLMGGTFDPVHLAHLAVAETAARELRLDTVLFMPTGLNPLKHKQIVTPLAHRIAMLDLAVQDRPFFYVSPLEGKRTPPSYSIDTVRELRRQLAEGTEIFFLVGLDAFMELRQWKNGETLRDLVNFVVVNRPLADRLDPATLITRELPDYHQEETGDWASPNHTGRIYALTMAPMEISASRIRARLAKGQSVAGQLPDKIIKYIADHGLYSKL